MKRAPGWLRNFVFVAAVAVYGGNPARAQTEPVVVAGPTKLADELLPATLEIFAALNGLTLNRELQAADQYDIVLGAPDRPEEALTIRVRKMASIEAQKAVIEGEADVAMLRGHPTTGPGAPLAMDALVAVVSRDNPLRAIAPAQLASVLWGETTSWAAFGQDDRPIKVYLMERGSDQARITDYFILKGIPTTSGAVMVGSEEMLTDAVAADPDGIGLAGFSGLGNTRALSLAGGCETVVPPDRMMIRNGDYPFIFGVSLFTDGGDLPDLMQSYLKFLSSSRAQSAVRQIGLVDVAQGTQPLEEQGRRLMNAIRLIGNQVPQEDLQRLVRALGDQERLSVTFRFQPGKSELDAGSVERVARLAASIAAGDFDGRKVTFVGFSDGVGSPADNLAIGMARAEAVAAAVTKAAGSLDGRSVELSSESFGETLPVACDDSDWGRYVNRRVEVWID